MFSQQSRHRYQPRIQSPTAFLAGKHQPGGSFPGRCKPSPVAQHPFQQSSSHAQLLECSGSRNPSSQTLFLRVFIFTLPYITKPGSPSPVPDSFTSFCTETNPARCHCEDHHSICQMAASVYKISSLKGMKQRTGQTK